MATSREAARIAARQQVVIGLRHILQLMTALDDVYFDFRQKQTIGKTITVNKTPLTFRKNWVTEAQDNSPSRIGYTISLGSFASSAADHSFYVHNPDEGHPAVNRRAAYAALNILIHQDLLTTTVDATYYV